MFDNEDLSEKEAQYMSTAMNTEARQTLEQLAPEALKTALRLSGKILLDGELTQNMILYEPNAWPC